MVHVGVLFVGVHFSLSALLAAKWRVKIEQLTNGPAPKARRS